MASSPAQSTDAEPPLLTIGAIREREYKSSRRLQTLYDEKGLSRMTPAEKASYANFLLLENRTYLGWPLAQQKDFLKQVDQQKIPHPLPQPQPEDLGYDGFERPNGSRGRGRRLWDMTEPEYSEWEAKERQLEELRRKSWLFKDKVKELKAKNESVPDEEIQEEKRRRQTMASLEGKQAPGRYACDPTWDDVVPIPQDDGETPLAAIAYTPEYAEATSYLRAVMATYEHSSRVLPLTAHIIDMNPAHYTVWLYRASTLFALHTEQDQLAAAINDELEWINEVALENEKNYQIWHHRHLLMEALYPTLTSEAKLALAESEVDFMTQMFESDSKNYHVWSYRQYLVKKLDMFNGDELQSIEKLLQDDVRNNSAWAHRFFVVFSDPKHSTPGLRATQADPAIPAEVIDREIQFAQSATLLAPQNQSPWNYLRGVLVKGSRKMGDLESFASGFVKLDTPDDEEEIKSSHALELLADVWAESQQMDKANQAWTLLGSKYDAVRQNYWEWRRRSFQTNSQALPIR